MEQSNKATTILIANTVAFSICFSAWMLNGSLVTFLIDSGVYTWNRAEIGWLIGLPVLTGSVMRLPMGILADKYGGRPIFGLLMLFSAVPLFLLSYADSYFEFALASLGFGFTGASFAVGVAYTSLWFRKERQGTALGIFGMGTIGAALTSLIVPSLLVHLTSHGDNIEGWRFLPRYYAGALLVTSIIFIAVTTNRKPTLTGVTSLRTRLEPLRDIRVWRFGLYYFLVFGGFVALSQWLIPYYLNVYSLSVASAGFMASVFSLPSGGVRAIGGYLSDRWGANRVMKAVLVGCLVFCAMLIVPKMDIESPGMGVMSTRSGLVTAVTGNEIKIDGAFYPLRTSAREISLREVEHNDVLILPTITSWQEPVVRVGDSVAKRQVIARGITHIHFQANIWIFTGLLFLVGFLMGMGMGAVYKHIPETFPNHVGVVGGLVGVIGGLGGFFSPILFGYLLEYTGIWTTCWMFFAALAAVCLLWKSSSAVRVRESRKDDFVVAPKSAT